MDLARDFWSFLGSSPSGPLLPEVSWPKCWAKSSKVELSNCGSCFFVVYSMVQVVYMVFSDVKSMAHMIYGILWCWYIYLHNWVIYWLVVWNMAFIFPYIGNNTPIWLICFRGVGIPPTSLCWVSMLDDPTMLRSEWSHQGDQHHPGFDKKMPEIRLHIAHFCTQGALSYC